MFVNYFNSRRFIYWNFIEFCIYILPIKNGDSHYILWFNINFFNNYTVLECLNSVKCGKNLYSYDFHAAIEILWPFSATW